MKPSDCYKFNKCSAAICPLDLSVGSHLAGEKVCRAAAEIVKEDGMATVSSAFGEGIAKQVHQELVPLRKIHSTIDNVLTRAATTGSKIKGGQR